MKPGRGCNICFKRVTRRAIISNVDATGAVMARGLRFRGNSYPASLIQRHRCANIGLDITFFVITKYKKKKYIEYIIHI